LSGTSRDGNATTWTNRRSRAISYTYNTNGQLTSKLFADGSRAVYAYDPRGNLTNATVVLAGRQGSSADFQSAVSQVSNLQSGGTEPSSVLEHGGPGGLEIRDTADWKSALQAGPSSIALSYNANDRLTNIDFGDGKWLAFTYDTAGRRASSLDQLGHRLTYAYDTLGNRIRTIENGVTTDYTANNLNQYVQRSKVGGQRTDYVFDLDGNLVAELTTDHGPLTTNAVYVYSDENRLIAVTQDPSMWQYAYDALGNLVATTENGVTKRFVINPIGLGNVVGEYDATGNLLARYDHGLGLLSRTDTGGNPVEYTFDAIGNAHQLVTSAGAIANAYAYAPFGALLKSAETIPNPFRFVGQWGVMKEGNELPFMRARFYSAHDGRFLGADPLRLRGGDLNFYRYVWNNPNRGIDPLGTDMGLGGFGDRCSAEVRYEPPVHGYAIYGGYRYDFWPVVGPRPRGVGEHTRIKVDQYGNVIPGAEREYLGNEWYDFLDNNCWEMAWKWRDYFCGQSPEPPAPLPPEPSPPTPPTGPGGSGNSSSPRPIDPNAKTGPAGFGTNGFITASGTLAYRVDFENETNASAPAQQVVITDPLSGHLDWSTFRLAEVGFGDQLIVVPPNSQHFETNVPVSYLGTNFEVQIEAGINLNSGQVYAIFRSIDPATSLPPPVNIGFLPPEDGTGRGRGHVSYTINAKPNLPTGTQIRNVALISFDLLPGIATNQRDPHNPGAGTDPAKECLNTIDGDVPTSRVVPLPATTRTFEFAVAWEGSGSGSGIAGYDI
jgi:RHS repeat-associated protein